MEGVADDPRPAGSAAPRRTVAVVDDERDLRESVAFAFEREGFGVETYRDGAAALEAFERRLPDLAVLDILMPRLGGLELCRRLRGLSESLPIIFLTSKDEEFDRVLGLELGADDYLCKPFSMRELIARARVLFRRQDLADQSPGDRDALLTVGSLELDQQRYTVAWNSRPVQLTVTEFLILQALTRHPGHVKTRRQLTDHAYPHDTYVSERTIDSHIKRLRRKFVTLDGDFDAIETVYGLGYRYRESSGDAEGD